MYAKMTSIYAILGFPVATFLIAITHVRKITVFLKAIPLHCIHAGTLATLRGVKIIPRLCPEDDSLQEFHRNSSVVFKLML